MGRDEEEKDHATILGALRFFEAVERDRHAPVFLDVAAFELVLDGVAGVRAPCRCRKSSVSLDAVRLARRCGVPDWRMKTLFRPKRPRQVESGMYTSLLKSSETPPLLVRGAAILEHADDDVLMLVHDDAFCRPRDWNGNRFLSDIGPPGRPRCACRARPPGASGGPCRHCPP